jgi:hypothetical protein
VVPVQEQEREQRARLPSVQPDALAADDDVERPEKPELVHAHRSSHLEWPDS